MNLHRAVILSGLQELSNATQFGRSHRVTFQANANEHWLQCTSTRIRMDWPFLSSPEASAELRQCFGDGLQIEKWSADAYVTLVPALNELDALISGIESVFRDLYGLGADYVLTYQVEED